MFERYSERARRVIFYARYEASQFGSTTIETEHFLLGLLREDSSLITQITGDAREPERIAQDVRERLTAREKVRTSLDLPLSAECKRIFANAAIEAEKLQQRGISIEHLLLGILREEKCGAAQILAVHGLQLDAVRDHVARNPNPEPQSGPITNRLQSLLGLYRDPALPRNGAVPDAETARKIAEIVLAARFGEDGVAAQRPFQTERKLTTWIVTGSAAAPEDALFVVMLRQDGRIVSMGVGTEESKTGD